MLNGDKTIMMNHETKLIAINLYMSSETLYDLTANLSELHLNVFFYKKYYRNKYTKQGSK